MGRIVRYEFMGNTFWFWLLFVSGIGLPLAILYLFKHTVGVEEELDDPSAFVEAHRAGRIAKG